MPTATKAPTTATEPKALDPTSLLWAHRLQRQHAALVSRLRELEATSDDHGTRLGGADTASAAKIEALAKRIEGIEKNCGDGDAIDRRIEAAVEKALGAVVERLEGLELEGESVVCKVREVEKRVLALEGERGKVFDREKASVKRLGEMEASIGKMGDKVSGLVEEVGEDRLGELEAGIRGLRELGKAREGQIKEVQGDVGRAAGVVVDLEARLQALDGRVGDLVEGVEREREYLAMELQRLEKRPATQSSSSGIVLAKLPATTIARAVPTSESASMLTARDQAISSDANVAEVLQARMADRKATPPLPVHNGNVPQMKSVPPQSVAGSTRTDRNRNVPVRKAAVQSTKENPATTTTQTQSNRKPGRPRKQPIQRQPTALTFEALKDHDSEHPPTQTTQSTGRKRKAATSIAPSERVTRSARTEAKQLASLPMDREKHAAPSRKRPTTPRALPVPRLARSGVQDPSGGARAAHAPALWPRQSTFKESGELLAAIQEPPKHKGTRFIPLD